MDRLAYGTPVAFAPQSIAGGTATPDQIFGAAIEQMRLVDNTDAAYRALEDAIIERNRAIEQATGVALENPLVLRAERGTIGHRGLLGERDSIIERQRAEYDRALNALAHEYPQHAGIIKAGTPVERDAEAAARGADEQLAELMASNPSWGAMASAFAGGMVGALRDPVTLGTLMLGGGPGSARTVMGRIGQVAAREALINAGTEAAVQPFNQAWREQAGLPHGFDQAVQNVLLAGALGGVLGGAGGGVHELVRALAPARAALPPEARGAIDMADQLEALDLQRPIQVDPERFDRAIGAADAIAQREVPTRVEPDEVTVNRLVNALAPSAESVSGAPVARGEASLARLVSGGPDAASGPQPAASPVLTLLRKLGPFDPSSPVGAELRAAGITSPSLFRKGGVRALDNVPHAELPEEIRYAIADDGNGYASQQAIIDGAARELEARGGRGGTDDLGEERAFYERHGVDFGGAPDDVRRQVLEIDDIGRRYDSPSDETVAVPEGVSRRDYTAQLVRDVLRAQPGLSTDLVRKAVNLSLFERQPIGEALDDVLSEAAGVPSSSAAPRGAPSPMRAMIDELGTDPLPFSSSRADGLAERSIDSEEDGLDLAAERAALEELGFDGSLPMGDDLMSLDALEAELEQIAWLERVVEACKL